MDIYIYITSMLNWTTGPYQTQSTISRLSPQIYSELEKSAFSFCALNTWKLSPNHFKIDTVITPGQFKAIILKHFTLLLNCFH